MLPDDESVLAIDITGHAWIWQLDPGAWARQACLVANRDLTRSEWNAFLPDHAYEPSCSR